MDDNISRLAALMIEEMGKFEVDIRQLASTGKVSNEPILKVQQERLIKTVMTYMLSTMLMRRQEAQIQSLRKPLADFTEPEIGNLMQSIAKSIDVSLKIATNDPSQFALVVFNDPKIAHYVASCSRESTIAAMRETADRLERGQHYEAQPFERKP